MLLNAIILAAARAAGVAPGFRALTWPPVMFLTVVGAGGAVGVYWLLARRSDSPDRTFTVVAAVVLVLSFVPDLLLLSADESATAFGVAVLMVMHVAVAAACVGALARGGGSA
ncbi:hypothetical protein G9466_00600 [Halorussus sp. JP-T4]|nr:hypothetical protein [Halorussus sp. JP-T4]